MTTSEWWFVGISLLIIFAFVGADTWWNYKKLKQIEEQSRSDREMPKECGLKAQIREAVVEVMAEERAEEAKYDKHSKFVRDYLSIEAAKRQIKPLSADDVRKKLGIKPSEVDYDLSDVPVAQMVEELRMRKDVAAKRIGNGEYVNVQFSNLPSVDIVNNSFGITGPAEVIVISYEKGDDE